MLNLSKLKIWTAIGFILVLMSSLFYSDKLDIFRFVAFPAMAQNPGPVCSSVTKLPQLRVEGKWLKDEAGNNVTLRGKLTRI